MFEVFITAKAVAMKTVKAAIFDFIGTLTAVEDYSFEESERKLYESIRTAGFNVDCLRFIEAYEKAHQKYRTIRYQELIEVTNAVWVSDALNSLGWETTSKDEKICMAIDMFFEDYIQSLKLRSHTEEVLKKLATNFPLGLVSNFTCASVVHVGLQKLGIRDYFDAVLVSQDFGWRKPSSKVFQEILRRLNVAGEEAVYVGDSPQEDIKGAQSVGMKTVFIPSQFYSFADLEKASIHPDFRITDLEETLQILLLSES
jgi:HAD superfamily hydrolase (TIGR01549 family)